MQPVVDDRMLPLMACLCSLTRGWAAAEEVLLLDVHADVDAYFAAHPVVVPHCDQGSQRPRRKGAGTCIYMNEVGAIVHGRDLDQEAGSGKQMLMDMMLRGVVADLRARRTWTARWASFLMVYAASGPVRDEAFPVVAFGKREPDKQPGLLVPNPFFVTPQWWDRHSAVALDESARHPWQSRRRSVLFRGACGPGAHARFRLLRMADPEHRLDVGFTSVDGYSSVKHCVWDLAARNDGSRDDVERILNHRILPHVAQTNFSRYQYLLHMPGSATGSYSRNLQYLWTHGAIVLIWKHTADEWYYRYLRDGVHYLSVDEASLYDTLRRLDANPREQIALRRGSRQFAAQYLSGHALVGRWQAILGVLHDRQPPLRPPVPNSTACTCDDHMLSTSAWRPCAKCDITRKRGRSISKFVGLVPKANVVATTMPQIPGPGTSKPLVQLQVDRDSGNGTSGHPRSPDQQHHRGRGAEEDFF